RLGAPPAARAAGRPDEPVDVAAYVRGDRGRQRRGAGDVARADRRRPRRRRDRRPDRGAALVSTLVVALDVLAVGSLYLWAARRARSWPPTSSVSFLAGLAVAGAAAVLP